MTRQWGMVATLSLCVVITGIDNTVLNVALPTIVHDLGATGSELQWMVDAYTLVFAGLLLTSGSLADRYGRRHALMLGLAVFGISSLLTSFASSPAQVIAGRALMGVGAALLFPATLSILTTTFSAPAERARAIGIWSASAAIGVAIGPLVGGALVEDFGWASVFVINVPLCASGLLLVPLLVPNSKAQDSNPLDPIGAALSVVMFASFLFGIIEGPGLGWTAPVVLGAFSIALVSLVLFVWWEMRSAESMMDLRLFRSATFSAASASISLVFFALLGSTFLLTQYFQFILGYSPFESGIMLVPVALGVMVGSTSAPRLVHRVGLGTKRVVVLGLVIGTGCMLAYSSDSVMSLFVLGFSARLVSGFSTGLSTTPATDSMIGAVPTRNAGLASAMNNATRMAGGAIGVAVLGSVFAAHYQRSLASARGLTPAVVERARESIGKSLEVAAQLPAGAGRELQEAARRAFLSSMRITFTIGALAIAAAVVVAARYLPSGGAESAHEINEEYLEGLALAIEDATD